MEQFRIKRALISVTDKSGVVEFARALADEFGVEIVSTGGTAKVLSEAGIVVRPIDDLTGFQDFLSFSLFQEPPVVIFRNKADFLAFSLLGYPEPEF